MARSSVGGRLAGTAFCMIFVAVGAGLGWWLAGRHLVSVMAARSWTEVPCDILASEVTASHGSKSTSYDVAIRYRYEVDERPYESDRFAFRSTALGKHAAQQAIVDAYPVGSQRTCFVDPADPHQAVLDRSARKDLLVGLFPCIFLVFGLGFIYFLWFGEDRSAPAHEGRTGPITLRPKQSPLGKFVSLLVFNLLWNGFIGVVSFFIYSEQGTVVAFPFLCLSPFILIGLLLFVSIPYQFLALFNPRPTLTLSTGEVRLGHEVELAWRFSGPAFVLRRVEVALVGTESATYRVGTSSSTATETFLKMTLVDTDDWAQRREGKVTVTLPLHTMHTFEAGHNKIDWKLTLQGHITLWPDVSEEFPLRVLPVELVEG